MVRFRLPQGMDIYSNILYVKEDFAGLSNMAHHAIETDKYRPESVCIVGNYYSLKGQHEKVRTAVLPQLAWHLALLLHPASCRALLCGLAVQGLPLTPGCHMAGCDVLPARTEAQPKLPVRLDAHGTRVRGDEEHARSHWCVRA